MPHKLFTPRSAREALDKLRADAEKMCGLFKALQSRHPETTASDTPVEPQYFSMLLRFHEVVRLLHTCGVLIKDPKIGLLDFPARRAGRTVFLCWKVGEDRIDHWHEVDAGFAGRQPLDEDGPWEEGDEPLETTG